MFIEVILIASLGYLLYIEYNESRRIYPDSSGDLIPEIMDKIHKLA